MSSHPRRPSSIAAVALVLLAARRGVLHRRAPRRAARGPRGPAPALRLAAVEVRGRRRRFGALPRRGQRPGAGADARLLRLAAHVRRPGGAAHGPLPHHPLRPGAGRPVRPGAGRLHDDARRLHPRVPREAWRRARRRARHLERRHLRVSLCRELSAGRHRRGADQRAAVGAGGQRRRGAPPALAHASSRASPARSSPSPGRRPAGATSWNRCSCGANA